MEVYGRELRFIKALLDFPFSSCFQKINVCWGRKQVMSVNFCVLQSLSAWSSEGQVPRPSLHQRKQREGEGERPHHLLSAQLCFCTFPSAVSHLYSLRDCLQVHLGCCFGCFVDRKKRKTNADTKVEKTQFWEQVDSGLKNKRKFSL